MGSRRRRSHPETSRYRWTNRALLALVAAYLALALERETVGGRGEFFPMASWSLFSLVPNEVRDYTLIALRVDGRTLDPPALFELRPDLFPGARSHAARITLQRIGAALQAGDAAEVAFLRRNLEHLHLRGLASLRYQIVARRYDPLERYRHGHVRAQRLLATFELREPERQR